MKQIISTLLFCVVYVETAYRGVIISYCIAILHGSSSILTIRKAFSSITWLSRRSACGVSAVIFIYLPVQLSQVESASNSTSTNMCKVALSVSNRERHSD